MPKRTKIGPEKPKASQPFWVDFETHVFSKWECDLIISDKIKSMEREADPELPAATDEVLNNSSVMGVASDASFETAFDA